MPKSLYDAVSRNRALNHKDQNMTQSTPQDVDAAVAAVDGGLSTKPEAAVGTVANPPKGKVPKAGTKAPAKKPAAKKAAKKAPAKAAKKVKIKGKAPAKAKK